MSSTRDQVFAIPELLETILLHLPPRDLLVSASRVSQAWNTAIRTSPTLQQSLFFQPWRANSNRKRELNPLLKQAFPPFFPVADRKTESQCWGGPEYFFKDLDWNKNETKRAAYVRREASWRNMLVIQPPAKTVQVIEHADGLYPRKAKLQIEHGIRMGTIYDLVLKFIVDKKWCFFLEWPMLPPSKNDVGTDSDCEETDSVFVFGMQLFSGCRSYITQFKSDGYEPVELQFDEARRLVGNMLNSLNDSADFEGSND